MMIRSIVLLLLCLALSWGEENANAARCDETEAETQALKAEKAEMEKRLGEKDEEIRTLMKEEHRIQPNAEHLKLISALQQKVNDLEVLREKERHISDDLRGQLSISERKHTTLQNEVTHIRLLLDFSEMARKELVEASSEFKSQVTALTNDKRVMRAKIASMQFHLENAIDARRAAELRADRRICL